MWVCWYILIYLCIDMCACIFIHGCVRLPRACMSHVKYTNKSYHTRVIWMSHVTRVALALRLLRQVCVCEWDSVWVCGCVCVCVTYTVPARTVYIAQVCDMTHECERHDWPIVWHDSYICVLSCVWHDPWICATWFIYLVARLIHMCTLMGVTWPMNVCDMIYLLCGTTHTYVYPQMCDMTHLHVCDMTHPLVCDMTHPHLTDK